MSVPPEVLTQIVNALSDGSRLPLTFYVTSAGGAATAMPVACMFVSTIGNGAVPLLLPLTDPKAQGIIEKMVVYNLATSRLETLDKTFCAYMASYGLMYFHAISSGTTVPTTEQFGVTGDTPELAYIGVTPYAYLRAYFPSTALLFCATNDTACASASTPNISVLNYPTMGWDSFLKSGYVQDLSTLCCYNDPASLVEAFFTWDKPMGQTQTVLPLYSSQLLCQQQDPQCKCINNRSCWMFNKTNVPCCTQGNPSDPIYLVDPTDTPYITQSQADCESKALNCAQWKFNTDDVPCCIQRTPQQWSDAGYSSTGLQSFTDQGACETAAANQCSFAQLLTPPTSQTGMYNFYKAILENKFTGGCELLRSAGPYGSSTNCSQDANQAACIVGNCDNNFCKAWVPTSGNPFVYSQTVRCLPYKSCCTGSTKQVISNAGKYNTSASCQ